MLLSLSGGLLGASLLFIPSSMAQDRYFTVRDSIAMSRFSFSDASGLDESVVRFSPDNRYFAVVTSRGILRSNTIESTLWVYSTAEVRAFLRAHTGAHAPKPSIAARVTMVPDYLFGGASNYPSLIHGVQWLPNSQGIVFRAEDSSSRKLRLYQTDIVSGIVRPITPLRYDVKDFTVGEHEVVYRGVRLRNLVEPAQSPLCPFCFSGTPVKAVATDITGATFIMPILFRESFIKLTEEYGTAPYPRDFLIERDGSRTRLLGADAAHLPISDLNIGEISHDGRMLLTYVPVKKIPPSWGDFVTADPRDPRDHLRPNGSHPEWLAEYGLVDLETGTATPLIDAPTGHILGGYDSHTGSLWSPTGKKALLMYTFLPHHRYPCYAAVVDVASKVTTCLAFRSNEYIVGSSTSYYDRLALQDGTFGATDDDIVLKMQQRNSYFNRYYHKENGTWRLVKVAPTTSDAPIRSSGGLRVRIRQDLNTPPALWASDAATGISKKLWDPNPQLARMHLGKVSVIRWKDANGSEWAGGLVLPPNYVAGKRYPLVIQTHGFDPDAFMTDGMFPTGMAARPLASAGIVVLQIDEQISGHPGSASQELPAAVEEFKLAVARLNALGLIDPERVGAIGFSRTSWYVEGALIEDPQLFAAASLNDGTDRSYMDAVLEGYDDDMKGIYGTPPFGEGLATWMKEAVNFNLDRVQAPLLIISGNPMRLIIDWEKYASLRMQKKPVDLLYIPDDLGHPLQMPLERFVSQQTNVDWFRFWLQGYEDPNPTKRAQYKRWEGLRKLQESNAILPTRAASQ